MCSLVHHRRYRIRRIWESVFLLSSFTIYTTTLFVPLDHKQSYCKDHGQTEEAARDAYAGLRSCAETGASTLIRTFV